MAARDIAHPAQLPETTSAALADLPYDELLRIVQILAPDASDLTGPVGQDLPVQRRHLTPEVLVHLGSEQYLARVKDLVAAERSALLQGIRPGPPEQFRPPAPQPALPPAPAVPPSAWKYSILALSTGAAMALAGIGLGAAAPALAALQDLLAAAGQVLMGIAALVVALCAAVAVKPSRGRGQGAVVNIRKAIIKKNRFTG